MITRTYLTVRYDVTDLTEDERGQLALEAIVQHEKSDGHPSVEVPDLEWDEIEEEETTRTRAIGEESAEAEAAQEETNRLNEWAPYQAEDGREYALILWDHKDTPDVEQITQAANRGFTEGRQILDTHTDDFGFVLGRPGAGDFDGQAVYDEFDQDEEHWA